MIRVSFITNFPPLSLPPLSFIPRLLAAGPTPPRPSALALLLGERCPSAPRDGAGGCGAGGTPSCCRALRAPATSSRVARQRKGRIKKRGGGGGDKKEKMKGKRGKEEGIKKKGEKKGGKKEKIMRQNRGEK